MSLPITASLLAPAFPLAAAAVAAITPRAARLVVPATALGAAWAAVALAGAPSTADGERDAATLGAGSRLAVGVAPDRVGTTIALLTLLIGLVVLAFGRRSFEGDPRSGRFATLGAALAGSVAVTATGTTLTTLAIGWVGTSAALVGLLGLGRGEAARDGVRRTARTLAVGDAALVGALVLALGEHGAVDLRDPAAPGLPAAVAVLLVVAGVARSALLPAHRWLPATVAAPTPVSALLHAGVVNGAGVLVLRTADIATASRPAMVLLGAAGAATAVIATAVMLARADAKGALAWSTAGQMGFMAVQLAVGALASALFHLVGHAMYKAALFLGVGGTVRSVAEHRHLPAPVAPMARGPRLVVSAVVPGVAIATALAVFSPDLSPAAALLVVGFGWATGRGLVDGWLRSTDRRFAAVGIAAGFVAPAAYVAGMTAFKAFVAPALPADPAGVLPAGVLAGALVALALSAAVWSVLGAGVRARAVARLVALGSPPLPRLPGALPPTPAAAPLPLFPTPFHT